MLHVDSESVVKCDKYMVSVVKRNEIIEEFTNIKVIMVYAETTDHETYLDLSIQVGKFVGKGKYPSIYLSNYTSISFIIHPSSFVNSFIYPSIIPLLCPSVYPSIHSSMHEYCYKCRYSLYWRRDGNVSSTSDT